MHGQRMQLLLTFHCISVQVFYPKHIGMYFLIGRYKHFFCHLLFHFLLYGCPFYHPVINTVFIRFLLNSGQIDKPKIISS